MRINFFLTLKRNNIGTLKSRFTHTIGNKIMKKQRSYVDGDDVCVEPQPRRVSRRGYRPSVLSSHRDSRRFRCQHVELRERFVANPWNSSNPYPVDLVDW